MTDSDCLKNLSHLHICILYCSFFLKGDEKLIPKAIFTAVFWEEFQNESFLYARGAMNLKKTHQ